MLFWRPGQLEVGALLSAIISLLAWRVRALTTGGAVAAWVVGLIVYGIGGLSWGLALLVFFGTSSVLSRWRRRIKDHLEFEKSGRRDAGQVWANGGVAAICVLLPLMNPLLPRALITPAHAHVLFLAALAAATADTWATEVGAALGDTPRLITNFRAAPPGTSGAISMAGTLAALGGSALLASFAPSAAGTGREVRAFLVVAAAGFAGMLFDSLLGATVQAQWRDPTGPPRLTERPVPGAAPTRGWRWVGNDLVNLLGTLLAACLAAVLF